MSQTLTITLKDQRKLCYEVIASPNASKTVLYFHGYPGSQPEGGLLRKQVLARGIRLISIARPGYGESTFCKRTIADWPDDVLEFVDQLHIQQFYIIGLSGGGPYALACLRLPRDRLLRTAVVSSAYPGCMTSPETLLMNKLLALAARTFFLGFIIEWWIGRAARNWPAEKFEQYFVQTVGSRDPKEAECLEDADVRQAAVDSCRESFRQGGDAMAFEAKLLSSDWGIPVVIAPLDVWYGRQDRNLAVEKAAKALEAWSGELHMLEDESHLSLVVNHAGDILDSLVKQ